jgi:hypothetical protein
MSEINGELDTLIQQKIESDTDFQTSIADLSDDEKEQAIEDKKSEILLHSFTKGSKAEELANNYKIRAEKAESELKKHKPAGEGNPNNNPSASSSLNDKDTIAILRNNVHDDDIDFVKDYAKFKNTSVAEVLKLDEVKATLATKAEYRKTAEVTNTAPTRKGINKVSDDVLVKNLSEGKVPDKGSEDAERLFWARRGGKR